MNKAQCSRAGKALATKQTSSAGKALAQCRWGKKKSTAKPKAKPKASAPARRSRRLVLGCRQRQPRMLWCLVEAASSRLAAARSGAQPDEQQHKHCCVLFVNARATSRSYRHSHSTAPLRHQRPFVPARRASPAVGHSHPSVTSCMPDA